MQRETSLLCKVYESKTCLFDSVFLTAPSSFPSQLDRISGDLIMKNLKSFLTAFLKTIMLPMIVYLLFFVVCRLVDPESAFGSWRHMKTVLQQCCWTALIALGMSFNMLSGRWDFSYGGSMSVAVIIGGTVAINRGWSPFAMLLLVIALCGVLGAISGGVYLLMKVPAIVTSLGMVLIYEMVTSVYNGGAGIDVRNAYAIFGQPKYCYLIFALFTAIYCFILYKTKIGYDIRSIGSGQKIAKNIGVHPARSAMVCYIIGGLFLGAGAMLSVCMSGRMTVMLKLESASLMFDAMMCVIVGRYISEWCHNDAIGIIMGVLTMKLLGNGLLNVGLSSQIQNVAKGLFLLIFIGISTNQAQIIRRREVAVLAQRANEKYAAEMSGVK